MNINPLLHQEVNQLHKIPENSTLYHTGELVDYCRSHLLHLPPNEANVEKVAEKIQSVMPKWFNQLGQEGSDYITLRPLMKRKNEIILGTNLKHLELRISILQDMIYQHVFHLTLLINFNTILGRFYWWPFKIICIFIFKSSLKKLEHSIKNG